MNEIKNEVMQELNTQNLITFQENINKAKMAHDNFLEFTYLKNAISCIINIIEEDEIIKFKKVLKQCKISLPYYNFLQKVKNGEASYAEERHFDIERILKGEVGREPSKKDIIRNTAFFERKVSLLGDMTDKLKIKYGLLDILKPIQQFE